MCLFVQPKIVHSFGGNIVTVKLTSCFLCILYICLCVHIRICDAYNWYNCFFTWQKVTQSEMDLLGIYHRHWEEYCRGAGYLNQLYGWVELFKLWNLCALAHAQSLFSERYRDTLFVSRKTDAENNSCILPPNCILIFLQVFEHYIHQKAKVHWCGY